MGMPSEALGLNTDSDVDAEDEDIIYYGEDDKIDISDDVFHYPDDDAIIASEDQLMDDDYDKWLEQ